MKGYELISNENKTRWHNLIRQQKIPKNMITICIHVFKIRKLSGSNEEMKQTSGRNTRHY